MSQKLAVIAFVNNKKLVNHAGLLHQLKAEQYETQEINLPEENAGACSAQNDVAPHVEKADLLIIYLSSDSTNNVCLKSVVMIAEKLGIRIVSIWLENDLANSISAAIDGFSDALTPYADDLSKVFSGDENPWSSSDGVPSRKRKIKKHTCG